MKLQRPKTPEAPPPPPPPLLVDEQPDASPREILLELRDDLRDLKAAGPTHHVVALANVVDRLIQSMLEGGTVEPEPTEEDDEREN